MKRVAKITQVLKAFRNTFFSSERLNDIKGEKKGV